MFWKIKKTSNKTDCFLLEMLRAMLQKQHDGKAVIITQWKLVYNRVINPHRHRYEWIMKNCPFAREAREVSFEGFFLCKGIRQLNMPIRAEFVLTRNHSWGSWEMLRAFVYVGGDKRDYHFGESYNNAGSELEELSQFIRGMPALPSVHPSR